MTDWQTQSVRELFFYLATAGHSLTKEQIEVALWPAMEDPAKLNLRFKNELYRLRRAVGRETILFDGAYYTFNSALDHEFDVEAFEAFIAKAEASHIVHEQIARYENAMSLVKGQYLEDFDASWAWPERERLNQVYLSALLTLAELYQNEGDFSNALKSCQRALVSDPACEAIYQLMMQIYYRLGDRPSILRMYQACENSMRSIVDLGPSEETQALCRTLLLTLAA